MLRCFLLDWVTCQVCKKSVQITSYQECDTARITALKFIVGDRQTNAQVWLQLGTGVCQASSWLHLFSHLTRYANSEPCGILSHKNASFHATPHCI